MNILQIEQRFAHERIESEIQRTRRERLARASELRPARAPVRRTVGHSLVRLGSRLAGEGEPFPEPARTR